MDEFIIIDLAWPPWAIRPLLSAASRGEQINRRFTFLTVLVLNSIQVLWTMLLFQMKVIHSFYSTMIYVWMNDIIIYMNYILLLLHIIILQVLWRKFNKLSCIILYYTILYYTILYYTILYYTILYHTMLYRTISYQKKHAWPPCAIGLFECGFRAGPTQGVFLAIIYIYIISYHIISYHIISYHIISYHIISYHIISHIYIYTMYIYIYIYTHMCISLSLSLSFLFIKHNTLHTP